MIYVSYNPEHPNSYTVTILANGRHSAGGGSTLDTAYKRALTDHEPYVLTHSCESEEEFLNLKQTHPEYFL